MKKISILIIGILLFSVFSGCINEEKKIKHTLTEMPPEEKERVKLLEEKAEFIDKSYDTEKNIEVFIDLLETIKDLTMENSVIQNEDATKITISYESPTYDNEIAYIEKQCLVKAIRRISGFAEIKIENYSDKSTTLYFINRKDTLNFWDRLYTETPYEAKYYDLYSDKQVEGNIIVPLIQRIFDLDRNDYLDNAKIYITERETEEGFTYKIDIDVEVYYPNWNIAEEILIIYNTLARYIEETRITINSSGRGMSYYLSMKYTSPELLSFDNLIPTETFYDSDIYNMNWGFDSEGKVRVSFRCKPASAYKAILMDEEQNILFIKESKISDGFGYSFYIDVLDYTENILFLKIIVIPENALFREDVDWLEIDKEKEFIDRAKPRGVQDEN